MPTPAGERGIGFAFVVIAKFQELSSAAVSGSFSFNERGRALGQRSLQLRRSPNRNAWPCFPARAGGGRLESQPDRNDGMGREMSDDTQRLREIQERVEKAIVSPGVQDAAVEAAIEVLESIGADGLIKMVQSADDLSALAPGLSSVAGVACRLAAT